MKPGDVIIATLPGALETKVRPAVIVASETYLREHQDIIVGILTSKIPSRLTASDHILEDWQQAGLRVKSCFRVYVLTLLRGDATVVGRLSSRDWTQVHRCVQSAFASL